jgi:O-acetyl-ADP-ribose deacetylase (regulator of RNase III)
LFLSSAWLIDTAGHFYFCGMNNNSQKIEIIRGDITKQRVDAIVNAANSSLMGGGGVDGAIHRAGGPAILEECRKIISRQGSCPTGEAVITTGGNLPAKFVIHTVGPVWHGGQNNEPEKLRNCYSNSLRLAVENNLETIAFPNISTGIYGYPKKEAAQIAIKTASSHLESDHFITKVYFVCFDEENYEVHRLLLSK